MSVLSLSRNVLPILLSVCFFTLQATAATAMNIRRPAYPGTRSPGSRPARGISPAQRISEPGSVPVRIAVPNYPIIVPSVRTARPVLISRKPRISGPEGIVIPRPAALPTQRPDVFRTPFQTRGNVFFPGDPIFPSGATVIYPDSPRYGPRRSSAPDFP